MKKVIGIVALVAILGLSASSYLLLNREEKQVVTKFNTGNVQTKEVKNLEEAPKVPEQSSEQKEPVKMADKNSSKATVKKSLETEAKDIKGDVVEEFGDLEEVDGDLQTFSFESDVEISDQTEINTVRGRLQQLNDEILTADTKTFARENLDSHEEFLYQFKNFRSVGYNVDIDTMILHDTPTEGVRQWSAYLIKGRIKKRVTGFYVPARGVIFLQYVQP